RDWSSDVCSSDLGAIGIDRAHLTDEVLEVRSPFLDRCGVGQPGDGEDEQGAVSGLRLGGGFESRPVFEARAPEGALLGPRPTRPVRQFHARVRAETLRWTVVDEFGET